MTYDEKLNRLSEKEFFSLFVKLKAEPRWVRSGGNTSIQIIGKCHNGDNHSALFNPKTLQVFCFSMCGCSMRIETWLRKALNLMDNADARNYLDTWMNNQKINFSNRIGNDTEEIDYVEKPFSPTRIAPLKSMPPYELARLNKNEFDNSKETLKKLIWCTEDGISVDILYQFGVSYCPSKGSIILPHHNVYGETVGLYERSFKPLRKDVAKIHKEMSKTDLLKFPRAKYVPLLRSENLRTPEKSCWSFSNSNNLYGLHLAKKYIKKYKKVIVFEGAKSVMLAHQIGYKCSVATHTFGIHLNHISMLIAAGAEEIILAFDKQYEIEKGLEWELYEKKTKYIANKVRNYVKVSRMIDKNNEIDYKDAPIDKGKDTFIKLIINRELL